ncbi:MAG TPA: four helix bundle protein [Bacteroidales bacterium]|nr:four helix bundle protein [Bacteroidales bacterium]HNS45908.1 four helix bundle protein [Bacteroidales bacterium]
MRKELEKRLVLYAISIAKICADLKPCYLSTHLSGQILRSSSSAALNYGEAQAAESKRDFIHKISLVLKELRETDINLQLLDGTDLIGDYTKLPGVLDESRQLISIFYRMVQTAKRCNDVEDVTI